jgi:hypothetical protein
MRLETNYKHFITEVASIHRSTHPPSHDNGTHSSGRQIAHGNGYARMVVRHSLGETEKLLCEASRSQRARWVVSY